MKNGKLKLSIRRQFSEVRVRITSCEQSSNFREALKNLGRIAFERDKFLLPPHPAEDVSVSGAKRVANVP